MQKLKEIGRIDLNPRRCGPAATSDAIESRVCRARLILSPETAFVVLKLRAFSGEVGTGSLQKMRPLKANQSEFRFNRNGIRSSRRRADARSLVDERYQARVEMSPNRANPDSDLFDPERAAILHARSGNYDEAIWLIFLSIHFGKHAKSDLPPSGAGFISRHVVVIRTWTETSWLPEPPWSRLRPRPRLWRARWP